MKISVELEENPGLRFIVGSGTAEYEEYKFCVSIDVGCGVCISVDGEDRYRLSPEELINGLGKALGIAPKNEKT